MTELDRDAIVDTALELFISGGYASTTLADIAAASGVDLDTLAAEFPDNDSFIVAVVDDMFAAVFEELATAAAAEDLVEALRDAHQIVLSRTVAGEGPVPLFRMQQMGIVAMKYPDVAQMISDRRKKMLPRALAEHRGVGVDDPEITRAVTVWSAVVTATYAAGINDKIDDTPQVDLIDTDRMGGRLDRTFTQVTGKGTTDGR
ncbi:TetR family transcriptional regulator [Mycobacterium sp. BK086]|uniref:TetR/AcrR family transcriptional regulator n=1 Tax=Mycobacterium sp. BK086 TaxID=2512165 RepID=UPI00105C0C8C|nr:TetR/AcrR family transcriptional regulator [Mycobacterium sp. BK086]TDO17369.1 TetR family transcriptional regulator [Mycobacterium sp. BK086]